MTAIYKKEVLSFFRSMMGYLYTAFLLLIAGVFFTAFNLQGGVPELGMCWAIQPLSCLS